MSSVPSTTTKIPAPLHARLKRGAKATGLKKSVLLRLCIDVGLPQVEGKFGELRQTRTTGETGVGLAMTKEQLAELQGLYKSAVTDYVSGADDLEGKAFVAWVEKFLSAAKPGDPKVAEVLKNEKRIRRFLAVYAQLF